MAQYELNLRDYLRIIRKKRMVIIATFVVVTLFSSLYSRQQKATFTASATVKIEERKTIAGLLTEMIVYNPADIMESQTRIIKGFPVMKKVAERLGMIPASGQIADIYATVDKLQGMVNTEIVGHTNIIKITTTTDSSGLAIKLANTVAEVYVEESLLEKSKQARVARQFIEEQLATLRTRFAQTDNRLKNVEERVSGIKLSEPLQKKLVDMQFELTELEQKYTDKHPLVLQKREEIKATEKAMSGFSGEELEYSRLLRDAEVNKKLYTLLSERLEEARITEAQKVNDVTVLDPAVVPVSSEAPQKNLVLLTGALAGLVLGFIMAFVLETLDTSISSIEDVEDVVKLPVLGVIPSALSEKERGFFASLRIKAHKNKSNERYVNLIVHYNPNSGVAEACRQIRTNLKIGPERKTFLVTSTGPREGKTTISTSLGLTITQTKAKTLLVSSDLRRPTLEKAFGVKREPGLSEIILEDMKLEKGLRNISDIMLGEAKIDDVSKFPGLENIWILAAGHLPLNPAEILESKKMGQLMEELRNRFDVVIFDSPPVLPITDASLLASRVDSVVLVYEAGRISRSALLRAKIQLESVGGKISGLILNHINPKIEAILPYYYRYKYYKKEEPLVDNNT